MEEIRQLMTSSEVGKTKEEVMHHHRFKDDLEEVVEEALSKRRGNTTTTGTTPAIGDGSTLTNVSFTSYTRVSASSSSDDVSAEAELDNSRIDEPITEEAENDDNEENSVYFDDPITEEAENDDNEENSVYLGKNEGSAVECSQFSVKVDDFAATFNENGDIQQVLSVVMPVISGKPVENLAGLSKKEPESATIHELEESDEEVVELEFETAVDKMHTHKDYNMYCPRCSSQITKVVLRRKKRHGRVPVPRDLFGCLSCLSIFFVSSDNGADVIIPVPDIPIDPTGPVPETVSGSSRSLEIVKSIVYGGLLESIASLSVVSSAAASDAPTLNIVALGLANLVGGLVLLVHNLRDLRYGESNQTNEERYKEELGKKEHFLVHATVAVLSYIIFGLIPPVIYGFTFRETNDRDFKMMAVAAASFLCIFILAIAKVYGRGEHQLKTYLKTVLYYLTSATMASGVAFAVGDLAKKLIEQLGWFDPATVEPRSFQSTWASR